MQPRPPLMQHQVEGIEYVKHTFLTDVEERRGALIAHDMGLGKTVLTIKVIEHLGEWGLLPLPRPILVLCPNSVKSEWEDMYDTWADRPPLDLVVLDSDKAIFTRGMTMIKSGIATIAVASYNTLLARAGDGILDQDWSLVVFDEVHNLANPRARTTQCAYQLKARYRLGLTGTPFANKPNQLYYVLTLLQGYTVPSHRKDSSTYYLRKSNTWGTKKQFDEHFIRKEHGKIAGGKNLTCETSTLPDCAWHRHEPGHKQRCMALQTIMARTIMHRRTKEECLNLPPKQFVDVPLPLTGTQRRLYDALLRGVAMWVDQGRYLHNDRVAIPSILAQMTLAFGLTADARSLAASIARKQQGSVLDLAEIEETLYKQIPASECSSKLNWLLDAVDNDISGQIVIFSEFYGVCRILLNALRKHGDVAIVTGPDKAIYTEKGRQQYKTGQEVAQQFKESNARFLIGTSAAFEGLNLQSASNVVLFGKVDWRPGKVMQAIDRTHRIGQKNSVTVYRLYAPDTIEVWLQQVLYAKQVDFDAAIDGNEIDRHSDLLPKDAEGIVSAFRGDVGR